MNSLNNILYLILGFCFGIIFKIIVDETNRKKEERMNLRKKR